MDQDQLAEIVKDIEEEKALGKVSAVSVFRSLLNQPDLVSLSSANATDIGSANGYFKFNVNMPRPVLEAETLQLLTANIPLATQNIPDTACVFWYYRTSIYSGITPNANNLFFVRLLPSYYPPEFLNGGATSYGRNVTFNGYTDLAAQLSLSCLNDLAGFNLFRQNALDTRIFRLQFLPGNISLTYDTTINKFVMTGLLTGAEGEPTYATTVYNSGFSYGLNDKVKGPYVQGWGYLVYTSLVAGNVGNPLPVYPNPATAYWRRDFNMEGVATYSVSTPYRKNQLTSYANTLYIALQDTLGQTPGSFPTYWTTPVQLGVSPMSYLAAGFQDPNVATLQGRGQRTWNQYALFEQDDRILHNGVVYSARRQNLNYEPFPVPNATDNTYSAGVSYAVGDYVTFGSILYWYRNIKASQGNAPTGGYSDNQWWKNIEYDPGFTGYKKGDLVSYFQGSAKFYRCLVNNPPTNSITYFSANWMPSWWDTGVYTAADVPFIGLNKISEEFDMLDIFTLDGVDYPEYPFPIGIPPQPFNPEPRRILNSILGFTWNGVFSPSVFALIDITGQTGILSTSTDTSQLFNRLRPVPYYFRAYPPPAFTLTDAVGSVALNPVYTANGYANLVYTNVIYIYATIVAGSTLDTQRNTNLIATASANAGNLGIGFIANFIDTKLRVNNADIYTIGIELRDEAGEPYFLTNNAICSFTFKLTYKERPLENKE